MTMGSQVIARKLHSLLEPAIYPRSRAPLLSGTRLYATQSGLGGASGRTRKQITVVSDDGRVRWADLSAREKAARTTQQSVNFVVVVAGVVMTSGVVYFLWSEVFSPDSKTRHFNKAVDKVKNDSRCTDLLGSSKKIRAYGEPTWNKWARSRPIASTLQKDRAGIDHLVMHFNVEGPSGRGVVNLHMTKKPDQTEFEYKYLALDVNGQSRIYLENADQAATTSKKSDGKMFGIKWR